MRVRKDTRGISAVSGQSHSAKRRRDSSEYNPLAAVITAFEVTDRRPGQVFQRVSGGFLTVVRAGAHDKDELYCNVTGGVPTCPETGEREPSDPHCYRDRRSRHADWLASGDI